MMFVLRVLAYVARTRRERKASKLAWDVDEKAGWDAFFRDEDLSPLETTAFRHGWLKAANCHDELCGGK